MGFSSLSRLAAACLSVACLSLAADAQRVVRAEITLTGALSSGGPITFELHHTTGVARLNTTLGFFEPPSITAQMVTEMISSRTLDSVTKEIAEKLSDALEDSPEFRRRLIDNFLASEAARGKFVRATIKALS